MDEWSAAAYAQSAAQEVYAHAAEWSRKQAEKIAALESRIKRLETLLQLDETP